MSEAPQPWVDPANIPELMEILRRRLLSKVRIFEARCEKSDRLFQVVEVQGRPLALAQRMIRRGPTDSPNPAFRRDPGLAHRADYEAAWLDLSWDSYYLAHDPPEPDQPVIRQPYLLSAQCLHERLPVPLDWLREQVNAGIRKRVITDETRLEMGVRFRRG
jgi:hypothetical protein